MKTLLVGRRDRFVLATKYTMSRDRPWVFGASALPSEWPLSGY